MLAEVEREVNAAADEALAAPKPRPTRVTLYVYSPDVDPTSDAVRHRAAPPFSGKPDTMVDRRSTAR
jgi:2-oxoisovalerate dehydrogenase E1 component